MEQPRRPQWRHAHRDAGTPSPMHDGIFNTTEVYATGTSGYLTGTAHTPSTGWKAWYTVNSGSTVTGSPAAIYDQVTTSLDICALTSGAVSVISYKTNWGSWKNLGSTLIAP